MIARLIPNRDLLMLMALAACAALCGGGTAFAFMGGPAMCPAPDPIAALILSDAAASRRPSTRD